MSAPDRSTMKKCIQDLKQNNVSLLIRCCENTYNDTDFIAQGIQVEELSIADGKLPDSQTLKKWNGIVENFFAQNADQISSIDRQQSQSMGSDETRKLNHLQRSSRQREQKNNYPRIGIHCVAGLGRAPLLCAIALVNRGCEPIEAIELIRKNRKGALNIIQANFILEYKPKKAGKKDSDKCLIF